MPVKRMAHRIANERAAVAKLKTKAAQRAKTAGATPAKGVQAVVQVKPEYKVKIPRDVYGQGNSKFFAMKYYRTFTLDTGVSPTKGVWYAQQSFRLNSIALPYVGQVSGDLLPQGFNSVQNVFKNYKVYACKYRITFFDPEGEEVRCGVYVTSSQNPQSLSGTLEDQMAIKRGMRRVKNVSLTGEQRQIYTGFVKISQIEGLSKDQFNGDISNYTGEINPSVTAATAREITATSGYLPMKHPFIHTAITPVSSNNATCKLQVELTYYVRCFGREYIPLTQSQA